MHTKLLFAFCLIAYNFSALAGPTAFPTMKQQNQNWKQDMNDRANELQNLQQQNGYGGEYLTKTDFPSTYADVPFAQRIENEKAGLEPYKNLKAYKELNVKTASEYCPDHPDAPGCEEYKKRAEQQSATNNTNSNNSSNLSADDNTLIQTIVDVLQPQNSEEKKFFTALATDYVQKEDKNHSLILDDNFVYDFLSEQQNLDKYKTGLLNLSGTVENDDLKIYLDWDEILIQVSTVLDATLRRHGALVCENNRSWQAGIDTAFWVGTVAAAIASFGTGGVAAAGGRAAVGAGLKALAKGSSTVGLKAAGRAMSKAGSKQLAKSAVQVGLKQNMRGWAKYKGKGLAKRIAKKAGANLQTKKNRLLLTGAITGTIYETAGKPIITNGQKAKHSQNDAGKLYSLVESGISTEIINCQDLDYGEGCYSVCGYDGSDDDLNVKVFQPILGQTYCVSESDYTLYNTATNKPLMLDSQQYEQVIQKIKTDVADKGKNENIWKTLTNQKNGRHGCDWNEDDIDMYFGTYIYDPDTMEPSSNLIIEDVVRIDD